MESQKRAELFEFVKQKQIHVLFAQETHSDEKNAINCVVFSHNNLVSGGVAILLITW